MCTKDGHATAAFVVAASRSSASTAPAFLASGAFSLGALIQEGHCHLTHPARFPLLSSSQQISADVIPEADDRQTSRA